MNTEQKRGRAIEEWTPTGSAAPRDQYDSCVGGVVVRPLVSGASVDEVAQHLEQLERKSLGGLQRPPAVAVNARAARSAPARKLHALQAWRDAQEKGR